MDIGALFGFGASYAPEEETAAATAAATSSSSEKTADASTSLPRIASQRVIRIPKSEVQDLRLIVGSESAIIDAAAAAAATTDAGTPEKPSSPPRSPPSMFKLPLPQPPPLPVYGSEHRHRTEAEVEAEVQVEEAATFEMIAKYHNVWSLLAGLSILLYGHLFPKTLLVAQAVSVSGGGKLTQAMKDLYHHFLVAKKCVEDELPELARAKDVLQSLASDIAATMKRIAEQKALLQAGKVSQGHHDLMTAELNKALAALQSRKQQLMGLNSSVGRICMAVNPTDIQEICLSVYVCVAAAAAAVSHHLLARVAMALKIGASLSEKVMKVGRFAVSYLTPIHHVIYTHTHAHTYAVSAGERRLVQRKRPRRPRATGMAEDGYLLPQQFRRHRGVVLCGRKGGHFFHVRAGQQVCCGCLPRPGARIRAGAAAARRGKIAPIGRQNGG